MHMLPSTQLAITELSTFESSVRKRFENKQNILKYDHMNLILLASSLLVVAVIVVVIIIIVLF